MTNSLAFHLEVLSALPKTVGDIALGTRMRPKFQILCLMKKLLKRVLLWPQPPWQNQWFLIQLGLMHSLGRNLVVMLVWKLFLVPTRNKVLPSPLPQPPQQVKAPLPPGSDEAPKESKEPKPPASVGGGGDESDLDDSASNVVGPGRRDPNYFKFLGFNLTTDVFSQAGGYKALGIVYTMG